VGEVIVGLLLQSRLQQRNLERALSEQALEPGSSLRLRILPERLRFFDA